MNKKGFTLIEILATITIIGIIATIASINILQILETKNIENTKNKEDIMRKAACIYIELNENKHLKEKCLTTGCEISTDTLIAKGLLDEEEITENQIIQITKENNEKKCQIKKES